VKINDDGLSRSHFMIDKEGDDYLLKDLSSRNGTWVDGTRVQVMKLSHNDPILAGQTEFRFKDHRPSATAEFIARTGPHGTVIVGGEELAQRRFKTSVTVE
jgi:pSer/pThr/pTyr-binding forkhead associated (FHA) protein